MSSNSRRIIKLVYRSNNISFSGKILIATINLLLTERNKYVLIPTYLAITIILLFKYTLLKLII